MAEASDMWGRWYQNLIDAGCAPEMAHACISLVKEEKKCEVQRILCHHRDSLLDAVHENQKKLDCLDFLLYEMKKAML
jgi:hypothetical protein